MVRAALLTTAILAACGTSPASPSDPTAPSGGATAYVVKIALIGIDPSSIEVPVGARVTFVNKDQNFPHHMASACPELDAVGRLEPGQSGETAPFTNAKTCKFYDRLSPGNPLRTGKIVVR